MVFLFQIYEVASKLEPILQVGSTYSKSETSEKKKETASNFSEDLV